jgi:hypothetical protein
MLSFYLPASGQVYTADELYVNTGFSPDDDPSVLAAVGIYTINPTPDPYDPGLYDSTPVYTIVGYYADESWTATGKPLPEAKENASNELKLTANEQLEAICMDCGLSDKVFTAVASQDPADRAARYQEDLDMMTAITDQLDTTLTAVENATSVDEINDIVHPISGVINTGRGSGLGPEDLNPSYYVSFNSMTLAESDTELYVPSTATVIPYDPFLPSPYIFDSMGDCFNIGGPYTIQIRVAATSEILAEFEVPLNAEGENVSF